jgi:thioredoxin 1
MIQVKKFSAPWCGPCKALAPEFKKIKEMFPEVKFVDVDVETDDNTVALYNVRTVPTVIVEKDNQIVERLTGLHSKQKYIDVISGLQDSA